MGTGGSPNALDQNSGSVKVSDEEVDALVGDQAREWGELTKKLRHESREEEKIPSVRSLGGFDFQWMNEDRSEGADGHDSAGQLTGHKDATMGSTSSTGCSAELRVSGVTVHI